MTDTQKIYEWCDRETSATGRPHGLLVIKASNPQGKWSSSIEVWQEKAKPLPLFEPHHELRTKQKSDFVRYATVDFDTPEEAIAKLAEALGL